MEFIGTAKDFNISRFASKKQIRFQPLPHALALRQFTVCFECY
tara:strand:- start:1702 stop:1830 length:129 start_codon:yes stop_codon:yes gene_type:complete